MQADEFRWLFGYDRWATRRVLSVLDRFDPAVWRRTNVVGKRSLGDILVISSAPRSAGGGSSKHRATPRK